MKFINKIIPLLFLSVLVFTACKKDLSGLDTNKIEGVTVDVTGMDVLNVFQFDRLTVNPKITTVLNEDNLSYEWRINPSNLDTVSMLIGTGKNLNAEIRLKPSNPLIYYTLKYTITDKTNGLKYITAWNVNVRNSIGEGLVIAETAADGISTDLSHIMSPLVTPDYTAESIKRKIYSAINGTTIPGIVNQLRYTQTSSGNALFAITNTSITKVHTLQYTFAAANADLFFSQTTDFKPQILGGRNQADIYVGNGKLTTTYLGITTKFSLPLDFAYQVPNYIALNKVLNDVAVMVNFYDELNGKFIYIPSVATGTFANRTMYSYPSVSGAAFNPASLPGKVNLAAGIGAEQEFVHVLKDKTTGNIALYTFLKGLYDADFNSIPPVPKALFDMTGAPGINDAIKFVILDNQRVLYYATPTKIYAMLYGGTTPTFEERYTVPAGENITTLQIYQQSNYPYGDGAYLTNNNNQLVMSTYGTEGKVYLLPMKNIGLGNIDLPNIKTFGGFGKITAITTQK